MTIDEFKQKLLPLQQKMYNTAYRLMCTPQDAEDMVQEAYIKLWSQRDHLPTDGNITGFCITLTRNLCIDHIRRNHIMTIDDEPDSDSLLSDTDASSAITNRENSLELYTLLSMLSPQAREVIVLRDIEGMEYAEISSLTGLSEVHIRVLISRGRKEIRRMFTKLSKR